MTDRLALDKYSSLIKQHRDINVDDDTWWEGVDECWKERLNERGIDMRQLYFSGFCSQGDGAMFEGSVCDLQAFMRAHKLIEAYPTLGEVAEHIKFCVASWKHEGRYYHERCIRFSHTDADWADFLQHTYDVELLEEMGQPIIDKCVEEMKAFADDVESIVTDYCVEIYRALEEEYDYLTSDEAVYETLEANDMLEDEDD